MTSHNHFIIYSFDDLKAGLAYLKRKSSQRHEGPIAFVKANLTTFMDCQDTLAGLYIYYLTRARPEQIVERRSSVTAAAAAAGGGFVQIFRIVQRSFPEQVSDVLA